MKRPKPEQLPPVPKLDVDVDAVITDILDNVALAMREAGLGHHVDDVLASVQPHITKYYGE